MLTLSSSPTSGLRRTLCPRENTIVGENYSYEFCVLCGTVSILGVQLFCDRKNEFCHPPLLPKNSGSVTVQCTWSSSKGASAGE